MQEKPNAPEDTNTLAKILTTMRKEGAPVRPAEGGAAQYGPANTDFKLNRKQRRDLRFRRVKVTVENRDIDPEQAIPLLRDKVKAMSIGITDAALDLDVTSRNPDAAPEEIAVLEKRLRARKWQKAELESRLAAVEEALNPAPKKEPPHSLPAGD